MRDRLLPSATPGPAVVGRPRWLDEFVRASDCRAEGREGELRALMRAGELQTVGRGVARWASSSASAIARGEHPRDDAFRARVRAAAITAPASAVTSHQSAALIWGLQSLDDWPARVVQTVPVGHDARTTRSVARHTSALSRIDVIDGLKVTTPQRTVIDVARTATRVRAFELVASAMFRPREGRPLVTLEEVHAEVESIGAARGVRAARALVEAAGTGCESPAEARSLLMMLDAGFARPEQQVVIDDDGGPMVVDCLWRDARLIGECDGVSKYLRLDRGDGRGAAEAVLAEKRREDRLRALGWKVVRWTTSTLRDAAAFAALLGSAGVPRASGRPR